MATHKLFKGIKRVLANNTAYTATTNNDYLYFVRTATADLEGDIWFQGVHYGHFGEHDLDAINTALAGFIGTGATTNKDVKTYIDDAIAELAGKDSYASGESADKHVKVEVEIVDSELTAVTVTTTDIASAAELDAVEAGLGFVGGTAYTNSGQYISGDTVSADIDRLDTAIVNVQSDFNTEIDTIETAVGLNLDGTHQTQSGKYISGATTVEGEIVALNNAIEAMDVAEISETGKPIVAINQTDGVVSAATGNINAEFVNIADEAGLFDSTNVEDALAELAGKVNANEVVSNDDSITITQSSGKTDLSVNVDGETIVKDNSGALKADLEVVALDSTEIAALQDVNVKEAYKLIYATDASRTAIGDVVKVYKDSSLKDAEFVEEGASGETGQFLKLTYILADGSEDEVYVNMSALLAEQEFKDGLQVSNAGEVSVKVDPTSEEVIVGPTTADTAPVLTVGANGVKVDHIQDAIDYAVSQQAAGIDADVTGASADGHVTVEVVQEDTEVKRVVVTTDDIASATALTAEETAREAADDALQDEIDAIETAVGLSTGGTYIADDGKYVSAATSVAQAVQMLNDALESSESAWADALAAETSARTAEDTALDGRLDTIEAAYVTGVTVNDKTATVTDHVADVDIEAGDIEVGAAITGETVNTEATDKVDEVLQAIVTALDAVQSGAYTGLTTTDNAIDLSEVTDNGQTIALKRETATVGTAQDGHIEIKESEAQGHEGELYGVMYWINDEE